MKRSPDLELMDQPERCTRAELVGALQGLRRVNRLLRGRALSLRHTMPLIREAHRRGSNPVRLCDIGTGAADIPIALVRRARRERIPLRIVAVELTPWLADAARRRTERYPEISVLTTDAREVLRAAGSSGPAPVASIAAGDFLPAPAGPFDIVTANLFLHHFPPAEVSAWLALMHRASRVGFVVNDLERHPAAYWGIRLLGWVLSTNRVFLHDAPLSVRRAYTPAEWATMARQAGIRHATVRRRFPWRILLSAPGMG